VAAVITAEGNAHTMGTRVLSNRSADAVQFPDWWRPERVDRRKSVSRHNRQSISSSGPRPRHSH